jgi:serine/threonine-protein kinase SRPK3
VSSIAVCFLKHSGHANLISDVQPSNILLGVGEKELLNPEDTSMKTKDTISKDKSHSVVDSKPIEKVVDRNQRIAIKLADFGVGISSNFPVKIPAMRTDHNFEGVIQPIGLRAPEVILGIRWDTPVDIWSAGCLVCSAMWPC